MENTPSPGSIVVGKETTISSLGSIHEEEKESSPTQAELTGIPASEVLPQIKKEVANSPVRKVAASPALSTCTGGGASVRVTMSKSGEKLLCPAAEQQKNVYTGSDSNANNNMPMGQFITPLPGQQEYLLAPPPPPPAVSVHQAIGSSQPQHVPVVPQGKVQTFCPKHPNIEITIDNKELWDQFYHRGTEMIVNRAGRRMFPGFSVSISGLKPKSKYTMKLHVILADNHRFKFLNGRWLAVGAAEPQAQKEIYVHPDAPNTGSFWMRHGVSFRKLKITNNKDKPGHNALLHSMHKYYLSLYIEEERKTPTGEPRQAARTILSIEFPETTFIAVTAYQNEEVTQLKISHNPFAKAFRENSADMDWETAQALYGSSYIAHGIGQPSGYMLPTSPSPWTLPSPLLSPALPVTPNPQGLPPHAAIAAQQSLHHPMISGAAAHYSPTESSGLRQSTGSGNPAPRTGGYFQWPTYTGGRSDYQYFSPSPTLPHPIDASPNSYIHIQSSTIPQLPDFDSVFTSTHT